MQIFGHGYAKNMRKNMQKNAKNMQKNANFCKKKAKTEFFSYHFN